MKRLLAKFIVGIFIAGSTIFFTTGRIEAQGFCYATGGWVPIGGTNYFVCPMGGGGEACAYPCKPQQ